MKICKECGHNKVEDFVKGFLICNKCVEKQNKEVKSLSLMDKKFQIIKGVIYSKPENFKKEIGFCYFEKDIKSAIEYFKEIVRQQDLSLRKDIFDAINMAFEGVLQSKNEEEKKIHVKITDYNREKFNELTRKIG